MRSLAKTSRALRAIHGPGFTLVEVLIVVTILGIVGAIVVPQVSTSHHFVAQAATRSIIANLNTAQNEAIARQAPVGVRFMPGQNRYRLINAEGKPLKQRNTPGGTGMGAVDFDEGSAYQGVEITEASFADGLGPHTVMYDAMGSPDCAGVGTIRLKRDGNQYEINVASFTGRITVQRVP
jgi:type II secretion system protein H